jgi:DNA-binding CsgD family transcriptional regulator
MKMELTAKELAQLKEAYRLSPRETQVLDLICQGVESNQDIADRLDISLGTSRGYVHDLFAKVGVSSKYVLIIKILDKLQDLNIFKRR